MAEMRTLAEFILAQCTDAACHSALPFVGKPNTRINVDSDGV